MKQRFYGLLAVLMTVLLAIGVSASAGMYTYDSADGEYWSPEWKKLDKNAVSLWLEDGIAAGYNTPNYVLDSTGVSYLADMKSGWYEVVLCGLGTYTEDFPEDIDGKIAFCIRGDSTFTIKSQNAEDAGAVACLVGNNCRAAEKIDSNGNVTGEYENITMNMDYYTVPAASLSSDITVRLVAATADVAIAEAVSKVTEIYNGALEFGLEHKQTARVFLGTEEEYWNSFGTEENTWHPYRNLRWYFDTATGTLTIAGKGAVPDVSSSQYPWNTYFSKVHTVIIEEGITELPGNAISSFGSFYVKAIRLPASLTVMDAYEFTFFDKLANITVSEANERYYVEDGVLYESANNEIHLLVYPKMKENLTLYTVPEGVIHIGARAFYDNTALTKLTLPKSLERIEENSFYLPELIEFTIDPENAEYTVENGILYTKDMTALIAYPAMHPNKTYTFPDTVTTISTAMFLKTAALETLIIPASVTEILSTYALAFDNIQLKEIIVATENPNYCSADGILYSKDMTTLIFYPPCKNDTVYRMPNTVTFVKNHAFSRLVYMEKLYFSPNIKDWNLMGSIFATTPKLTSIYFYSDYDPRMSAPFLSMYMSGQISKITLYYIEGMKNWTSPTMSFGFATVKTATFEPEEFDDMPWETFENIQWYFDEETGTLTIAGEGAIPDVNPNNYPWYTYSSQILSVVIEEGVTGLFSKAINCFGYNFTEIHLPATLTTIDAVELNWKYRLETITVAEENERYYVEDGVLFERAEDGIHLLVYPQTKKDVTSYTVPEGVTRIGDDAFSSNVTLTELILPDSLEAIGNRAFQIWNVTTLYIPAKVNEISLSGITCSNLTKFTIDSENMYYVVVDDILYTRDMTELTFYPANHPNTSFTVPDTITTIPNSLFQQVSNLETLTIPASVTEIVDTQYYSLNDSLKSIQVEENNPNYCDVDGILYTKDMTKLMFYPPCKEDTVYRMPDTVTDMHYVAMAAAYHLEELHLSPVITDWYNHYNFCNIAPKLTSVYFYEKYYAGIANAFRNHYYDCGFDNLTFYYLEGMSGWTSPTMSFGYADVNTAAFQLNPEDFGDLPWQVFQNILWYFDEETATLYLGGYGEIPELKDTTFYPWYMPKTYIQHLYVKDGITGLNGVFLNPKWCDFYSVRLPATLRWFNTSPFQSSTNLEAFTMEKTNTDFYVEDGVLYLKNGSKITFMCYPAGKKDKSYTLPEGLTRIPSFGMWADALEEIILPESLVTINNRAFSSVNLTSIHIPANAVDIGRVAFLTATELESITVDPKNETYTSVDGVMYTKNMKMLHTYPIRHTAVDYTVPEGVLEIPIELITGGESVRTLNLPASLETIYTGGSSFNYYCTLEEIHVDADNPYFSSMDGVMYNKAGSELLYYPISRTNVEFCIPDSVKVIGKYAFQRTVYLETLYIGANLKEVTGSVAQRADSLSAVYFPAGVPAYLNDLLGKYYEFNQTILHYPEGAEGWTEGTMTVDGITYRTVKIQAYDTPGDITGDGKADADDLLDLANYFAGHVDTAIETVLEKEEVFKKVSGFDNNPEDFSRYDAMYIARALAGWEGYELP